MTNATTQRIVIDIDGIWAGTGDLRDGKYVDNCGAQFCNDNDASLKVYDEIESAIERGEESISVEIDGETHTISWMITEAE